MLDSPLPEIVDVAFTIAVPQGTIRSVFPVPTGPTTIVQLLPILQNFTSGIAAHAANSMAHHGKAVTCGPKCSACCRQLVPISPFEAESLALWIRSLPGDQQQAIASRFQAALLALQEKGVLSYFAADLFEGAPEALKEAGLAYFSAGVPCPFLVDDLCGIHPNRPLVCREYMVVTPPEYCAEPGHNRAQGVILPVRPSRALIQLGKRVDGDAQGWLPLVYLFHWMAAGHTAGQAVSGTGQTVVGEFLTALTNKQAQNHPAHAFDS